MFPCRRERANRNSPKRGLRHQKPAITSGRRWELAARNARAVSPTPRAEKPKAKLGAPRPPSLSLSCKTRTPCSLEEPWKEKQDSTLTSRTAHAGRAAAVPAQVVVLLTLLPAVAGPLRAQLLRGQPWGEKRRRSGRARQRPHLPANRPSPPAPRAAPRFCACPIRPSAGVVRLRGQERV